ncbi:reticulocyte-binding protein homolog 1 [Patella vulgata]|uniref:reticulocyte-binding protein homolog 1 n=1 Tax=Patella vulgata TaxID=6465 RepID=UPI0024A9D480|nr:reticulocyte-binding protein homolog 1 [Patella vulgata]
MAKRTALEFYRKRQTVESLATERPQSLKSVYDIINSSIAGLEERLDMLMTSYYGSDETLDNQLKRWLPLVNTVLRQGKAMELVSKEQIEEFYIKHDNLLERSPFCQDNLDEFYDVINHIIENVNDGFSPMASSVEELVGFMAKYLRSFSTADGDRYLETCTNYEKQKTDLERAILLNIKNIFLMLQKFEEECLTINHFDYISKELAERHGCIHTPILIVFPTACENIRNAFTGIRKWLTADASYVEYLEHDYIDLEQKRELQLREFKELQFKVSSFEYKFKSLQKEINQIGSELNRLKPKEQAIDKNEKQLSTVHKSVSVDLEIKLFRLTEMKQTTPRDRNRQFKEQLERLNTEINLLKDQRPKLDRSITDIQSKKSWIAERKMDKAEKERLLEEVKVERRKVKKLSRKCEVEIQRINECLQRLKSVKTKKTSEEILRKIFHNLPTVSRNIQSNRGKIDKIDRAFNIVARYIDGDWTKLYWQLPFYPARGEETKRQDIEDIIQNCVRHTAEDEAKLGLAKWRRLHTRVTMATLTDALSVIKRKDIVDQIKKELKPSPKRLVNPKLYRTVHFPDIPVFDCRVF